MEFTDLARVVMDTWRQLAPADRAPYEAVAAQEAQQHARVRHMFLELQHEYKALYQDASQTGALRIPGESTKDQSIMMRRGIGISTQAAVSVGQRSEAAHRLFETCTAEATSRVTGALDLHVRGLLSLHLPPKPRAGDQSGVGSKRPWQDGEDQSEDDDGKDDSRRHEQPAKKKQAVARREDGSIVKTVPVVCNSFRGDYVVATQRVRCRHASVPASIPVHLLVHGRLYTVMVRS